MVRHLDRVGIDASICETSAEVDRVGAQGLGSATHLSKMGKMGKMGSGKMGKMGFFQSTHLSRTHLLS